jgi:cyclohexadieny/prephenate dehydrogenase
MTGKPFFARVAVIGIGLIGSSLVRVMRRDGLAGHIAVCARRAETLAKALELGLADSATDDPLAAIEGADLVVLATPIGAYGAIAEAIGPGLKPGAIVTDVGSTKGSVIRDVTPHLPEGVHFVPAHPIAGTENSGPEAGFDSLFEGRWCILTPPEGCDPQAVEAVAALWRCAGSMIERMDAAHHDQVLAITSHLPHLIAYTIVGTATDLEDDLQNEVIKFSAAGFRDFTRIAASDPVMWRDVFLHNKEAVLDVLARFTEDLTAMQRAIRRGEGDTLEQCFTRTRAIRRGIVEAHQAGTFEPSEPEEDKDLD